MLRAVVLALLCALPAAAQTNQWIPITPGSTLQWQPNTLFDSPCTAQQYRTSPIARAFSGAAIGGGKIFYFGGGHASYPGNDVALYDIATNAWSAESRAPDCIAPCCQQTYCSGPAAPGLPCTNSGSCTTASCPVPCGAGGGCKKGCDDSPPWCVGNGPGCLVGSCPITGGTNPTKSVRWCVGGSRDARQCAFDDDTGVVGNSCPGGTCTAGIPTPGVPCTSCRPYTEHTYQRTAYNPDRLTFMFVGGGLGTYAYTWEWDPATAQWTLLGTAPAYSSQAARVLIWDPVGHRMTYVIQGTTGGGVYRYDYTTQIWTKTPAVAPLGNLQAGIYGAWDGRAQKILLGITTLAVRWFVYDPTVDIVGGVPFTEITSAASATLGNSCSGSAVTPCWNHGVTYDEGLQRTIVMSLEGATYTPALWAVDVLASPVTWTRQTVTAPPAFGSSNAGYQNMLKYDRSTGSLFFLDNHNIFPALSGVPLYRVQLGPGGPTNTPTVTPTVTPTPTPTTVGFCGAAQSSCTPTLSPTPTRTPTPCTDTCSAGTCTDGAICGTVTQPLCFDGGPCKFLGAACCVPANCGQSGLCGTSNTQCAGTTSGTCAASGTTWTFGDRRCVNGTAVGTACSGGSTCGAGDAGWCSPVCNSGTPACLSNGSCLPLVPLNDLGVARGTYQTMGGGLYPNFTNSPVGQGSWYTDGLAIAQGITALNGAGEPSGAGSVVFATMGFSNTDDKTRLGIVPAADADSAAREPSILLVNGAQGGGVTSVWNTEAGAESAGKWSTLQQAVLRAARCAGGAGAGRFCTANYNPANPNQTLSCPSTAPTCVAVGITDNGLGGSNQLVVIWAEAARYSGSGDKGVYITCPVGQSTPLCYPKVLRDDIAKIAMIAKRRYPKLAIMYWSGRTYAGYASGQISPEPDAYESSWGVKLAVEAQINGTDPRLDYRNTRCATTPYALCANDAACGGTPNSCRVLSPWIAWGPYLWANGTTPRTEPDYYPGLSYPCTDYGSGVGDGAHPGQAVDTKVGTMLINFLHGDPTAQQWYLTAPPNPCVGTVRQVGAGKTYGLPSQAAAAAQTNDCIDIDAGNYPNDIAVWPATASNLTIRGVGGRAGITLTNGALVASPSTENNKGLWIINSPNTTIENVDFSCATSRAGNANCSGVFVGDIENAAGIRLQAAGLTVRNCTFHDNDNAILGGPNTTPSGTVLIEHSEFFRNGWGDGQSHNVYLNENNLALVYRYNYSHGAIVGHNLKSRAQTNEILYNRIMDEDAGVTRCTDEPRCAASVEIEFPCGGLAYVIGNLIEKGPYADAKELIKWGAELNKPLGTLKCLQPLATFYTPEVFVVNNTMVSDWQTGNPSSALFVDGPEAPANGVVPRLWAYNNLLVGTGSAFNWPLGTIEAQTGNFLLTDIVYGNGPTFASRGVYDYHLSGLGALQLTGYGIAPGFDGRGYDLTPHEQYVYDRAAEPRPDDGAIDVGAYEYVGNATALPARTPTRTNTPPSATRTPTPSTPQYCDAAGESEAIYAVAQFGDDGTVIRTGQTYAALTTAQADTDGYNTFVLSAQRANTSSAGGAPTPTPAYRVQWAYWRWNTTTFPDGTAWPVVTITRAFVRPTWFASVVSPVRGAVLEWYPWTTLSSADWSLSTVDASDARYAATLGNVGAGRQTIALVHAAGNVSLSGPTGLRLAVVDGAPPGYGENTQYQARPREWALTGGEFSAQLVVCYSAGPTPTPGGPTLTPTGTFTPTPPATFTATATPTITVTSTSVPTVAGRATPPRLLTPVP